MQIPFINLTRTYEKEKKEIQKAVGEVLTSGWYLNGEKTRQFEKEFALTLQASHAISVGSGTDAIAISLLAMGIGKGDEVIIPSNVYPTVFGVLRTGATPVLSDCNEKTNNLDANSLEKVPISKNTKAIIFVHLYGSPIGIKEVVKFAKQKKLLLIEDCAHAYKASIQEICVGTFGDVGCFSFYPTKTLACFGDSGMIVTSSDKLASKIRLLKINGEKQDFVSSLIGYSSNLDELQAAVLRVKMKLSAKQQRVRNKLAEYYRAKLADLPIELPQSAKNVEHAYLNFVIKTDKRDELKNYLAKHGIGTRIHYPLPLHLQPSLRFLRFTKGMLPASEKLSKTVLSLPLYSYLTKKEIDIIAKTVHDFF